MRLNLRCMRLNLRCMRLNLGCMRLYLRCMRLNLRCMRLIRCMRLNFRCINTLNHSSDGHGGHWVDSRAGFRGAVPRCICFACPYGSSVHMIWGPLGLAWCPSASNQSSIICNNQVICHGHIQVARPRRCTEQVYFCWTTHVYSAHESE